MTVAQLITALTTCDQNATVFFDDDGYDKPSWAAAVYPEITGAIESHGQGVYLTEHVLPPGPEMMP